MKYRRAFTVVELLVSIAIIGILAAILLPVLVKSRNHSSRVTDINNLKEIMAAIIIYSQDNNDVLPWPNWAAGDVDMTGKSRPGWLYTYNQKGHPIQARFDEKTGVLWSMLNQPKIYLCPMDNPLLPHWSSLQQKDEYRRQQVSSYAMNGAVCGFNAVAYPPVRLDRLQPTDCAFWETDETEPSYFNDGANYPSEGVSARHLQGAIQAEFDSAVNYITLKQWYDDVAYTNRNRLWCYPGSPDGR